VLFIFGRGDNNMMCVDKDRIAAEIDKKECEYMVSILSENIESMEKDMSGVDWHKYVLAKALRGKISAFCKIMDYKKSEH
jgi:hypothetical protein